MQPTYCRETRMECPTPRQFPHPLNLSSERRYAHRVRRLVHKGIVDATPLVCRYLAHVSIAFVSVPTLMAYARVVYLGSQNTDWKLRMGILLQREEIYTLCLRLSR